MRQTRGANNQYRNSRRERRRQRNWSVDELHQSTRCTSVTIQLPPYILAPYLTLTLTGGGGSKFPTFVYDVYHQYSPLYDLYSYSSMPVSITAQSLEPYLWRRWQVSVPLPQTHSSPDSVTIVAYCTPNRNPKLKPTTGIGLPKTDNPLWSKCKRLCNR